MRRRYAALLMVAALAGCYTQVRSPDRETPPRTDYTPPQSPSFRTEPIDVLVLQPVVPFYRAYDPWHPWDPWDRWRRPAFGMSYNVWNSPTSTYYYDDWSDRTVRVFVDYVDAPYPWWDAWPDNMVWWRTGGPWHPRVHREIADFDPPAVPRPRIRLTGFEGGPIPAATVRGPEVGTMRASGSSSPPAGGQPAGGAAVTQKGQEGATSPKTMPAPPDTSKGADREQKREGQRRRGGMR